MKRIGWLLMLMVSITHKGNGEFKFRGFDEEYQKREHFSRIEKGGGAQLWTIFGQRSRVD